MREVLEGGPEVADCRTKSRLPLRQQLLKKIADIREKHVQDAVEVTYGAAFAPCLSIRCLLKLATEEADRFPEAAEDLQKQPYVDDILLEHTRWKRRKRSTYNVGDAASRGIPAVHWRQRIIGGMDRSGCPKLRTSGKIR
ncbi:UNVERIFIED_CONTAM: hypothetical protein PYX00_008043 [Menopon gallinae]|uniref:Uncharacterized protein n=1 Tax=Menopon gallinae TaxID=328185 RepID=A0AAW2HL97_9NEOP